MFGLAPHDKFTYEEYLLLPEGDRRELIEGELLVTPAPGEKHQRYSGNIEFELRKFLEAHPLGLVYDAPFDVILDHHNVVQPDILVVLQEGRSKIVSEGVRGAPDLVIEILSPSTAARDLVYKRHLYHRFRVKEYWVVDPDRERCHVLTWEEKEYKEIVREGQDRVSSSLLPGFELDLSKVFR